MPAEAQRLQRRLRPRDGVFVGGALAAAVALSVVFAGGRGGAAGISSNCVAVEEPGVMGAQTTRWCGADATAFCRSAAAAKVAERCAAYLRRAG